VTRTRGRWIARALLSAGALLATLAVFEVVLRLRGFEFHLYPTTVQMDRHGVPTSDMLGTDLSGESLLFKNIYRADPLLGWSPVPGYEVPGQGALINSLGYRGPAFADVSAPGTERVVCLGDSCTFIGMPTYPALLRRELGAGYEVLNAGVSGYSSYQGLVQLRERLLELSPDVVSVYFGWNDHWLARAVPDAEVLTNQPAWRRVLEPLRVVQWFEARSYSRRSSEVLRVSPEEYRENLTELTRLGGENGVRVVLMTAPWNVGERGHAFLTANGNTALTLPELHELHRRYNRVVREVAAEEGAQVVDLARIFATLGKDELLWGDGIHPNTEGYRVIARALAEVISGG